MNISFVSCLAVGSGFSVDHYSIAKYSIWQNNLCYWIGITWILTFIQHKNFNIRTEEYVRLTPVENYSRETLINVPPRALINYCSEKNMGASMPPPNDMHIQYKESGMLINNFEHSWKLEGQRWLTVFCFSLSRQLSLHQFHKWSS